jgi:hypothetical protein
MVANKEGVRLFVYALCEPDGKTIRYIGLSGNLWKRLLNHYRCPGQDRVRQWIHGLRERGLLPAMIVLREVFGLEEGANAEASAIAEHRQLLGDQLLNEQHTGKPQPKNRKGYFEFGGKSQSLAQWARELGISRQALNLRLQRHPVNVALSRGKDQSNRLGPTVPPPTADPGTQSLLIHVDERLCVNVGLTRAERLQRRIAMAQACHRGALVADVAATYGVTTATVLKANHEFARLVRGGHLLSSAEKPEPIEVVVVTQRERRTPRTIKRASIKTPKDPAVIAERRAKWEAKIERNRQQRRALA